MKTKTATTVSVTLILLTLLGIEVYRRLSYTIAGKYTSPSGNYTLVIHRKKRFIASPGDSTGSPGYVELFDRDGRKLNQADVPLVLDLASPDDVHWYDREVTVPGVFDFQIPKP